MPEATPSQTRLLFPNTTLKEPEKTKDAEGKVIVYDISEVEDFAERIGKNTNYIIHPEEILAENFVLAFMNKTDVPTPQLIEKIRNVLTDK